MPGLLKTTLRGLSASSALTSIISECEPALAK
jgi:hypothetical protein